MKEEKDCEECGESSEVSRTLPFCKACIVSKFERLKDKILEVHRYVRGVFELPLPSVKDRVSPEIKIASCSVCARECQLAENEVGFCGIRMYEEKTIRGPAAHTAYVFWYLDPLPTNCVADWICPAGTGCGYPKYALRPGPEYGFYNLAVFFEACNLNCLYCQNWHFRYPKRRSSTRNLEELVESLTPQITCMCFFGGDPSPQAPFAIKLSKEALRSKKGKILRICWETNGLFNKKLLDKVIELSLISGGIIKFDLKAWHEEIYFALCCGSKQLVFENFKYVAQFFDQRREVPLLTASTLLVPYYVDEEEVYHIARFIAEVNPEIPYRLLAFSPQFFLKDLPLVTRETAYRALELARKAGLKKVSIGNEHLLR